MARCSSPVSSVTARRAVLTVVKVSASEDIRDDLRIIVRGYLDEKVVRIGLSASEKITSIWF
jgi:hypothetical protein